MVFSLPDPRGGRVSGFRRASLLGIFGRGLFSPVSVSVVFMNLLNFCLDTPLSFLIHVEHMRVLFQEIAVLETPETICIEDTPILLGNVGAGFFQKISCALCSLVGPILLILFLLQFSYSSLKVFLNMPRTRLCSLLLTRMIQRHTS